MWTRRSNGALALALAWIVPCGLGAVEPGPDDAPKAEAPAAQVPDAPGSKKAATPSRRVPAHFGRVGLTAEQREAIYKVKAKHAGRIEALQQEIARAQAEVLAECEALLTDDQRKLLEEHRARSSRGRKASAVSASTAPPQVKGAE